MIEIDGKKYKLVEAWVIENFEAQAVWAVDEFENSELDHYAMDVAGKEIQVKKVFVLEEL